MRVKGLIKKSMRALPGVIAALVMLVVPPYGVPHVHAQSGQGNGFFNLFRREQPHRRVNRQSLPGVFPEAPQVPKRTVRRPPRPRVAAPVQQAAEPPAANKREDARVVLVIGDFLATGLAEGLNAAFRDNPGVRIVDRASGSSGIVRDDHFDWPGQINRIMDEEKPAAVVVMLGSNDRQQMKADGARFEPKTDGWMKEYARRATVLAQAVEGRGIPLVWVGMPAFRQGSLSSDMLAYNDIYRTVSSTTGADFVDIWDGFVDENGAFIATGPDINGQPVRLRGSDGINLTTAGKRKVAFYAEKPLLKILGEDTGTAVGLMGPAYTPDMGLRPGVEDKLRILRTVPISLSDPELDGGKELLGATAPVRGGPTVVDEQMREQREEKAIQAGRADHFGPDATKAVAEKEPAGTASIETPAGPLRR